MSNGVGQDGAFYAGRATHTMIHVQGNGVAATWKRVLRAALGLDDDIVKEVAEAPWFSDGCVFDNVYSLVGEQGARTGQTGTYG